MANQKDKISFSKRLNHALDLFGVPPKGKGRQVMLGKMFNVSQKAANKWLEATSLPDTMRIAVIAEKLGVNVEWLTYGMGPINIEPLPGMPGSRWRRIPLISWEQAGDYGNFNISTANDWVWTDAESGPRTYALKIIDDSMLPRFEPGAIVTVDPDKEPEHRNIVIFQWLKTKEVSCAQYLTDGPYQYLKPHNPDYKAILLNSNEAKICGTARQVFMSY